MEGIEKNSMMPGKEIVQMAIIQKERSVNEAVIDRKSKKSKMEQRFMNLARSVSSIMLAMSEEERRRN